VRQRAWELYEGALRFRPLDRTCELLALCLDEALTADDFDFFVRCRAAVLEATSAHGDDAADLAALAVPAGAFGCDPGYYVQRPDRSAQSVGCRSQTIFSMRSVRCTLWMRFEPSAALLHRARGVTACSVPVFANAARSPTVPAITVLTAALSVFRATMGRPPLLPAGVACTETFVWRHMPAEIRAEQSVAFLVDECIADTAGVCTFSF
jgi:hypothetical protein